MNASAGLTEEMPCWHSYIALAKWRTSAGMLFALLLNCSLYCKNWTNFCTYYFQFIRSSYESFSGKAFAVEIVILFDSPGNLLNLFLTTARLASSPCCWVSPDPWAELGLLPAVWFGEGSSEGGSGARVLSMSPFERGSHSIQVSFEKYWGSWWVVGWPWASLQWRPRVSEVALGSVLLAGLGRWTFLLRSN